MEHTLLPEIGRLVTKSEVIVAKWLRFAGCKVYKVKWPTFLVIDSEMRPVFVWILLPGKMGSGRKSANMTRSIRLFAKLGFRTETIPVKKMKAYFVSKATAEKAELEMLKELKGEYDDPSEEDMDKLLNTLEEIDKQSGSQSEPPLPPIDSQ